MDELEKRVRIIETQLAYWKGAFIVATVCVFAWVGVTQWVSLPKQVKSQVDEKIGKDVLSKAEAIKAQYISITTNKEASAIALGIPDIKADLQKQTKRIVYIYKTANDRYAGEGRIDGPIRWEGDLSGLYDREKADVK